MQFSDFVILEFVGSGEFAKLLIEEGYIGLIFAIKSFLFTGKLGQGFLNVIDL